MALRLDSIQDDDAWLKRLRSTSIARFLPASPVTVVWRTFNDDTRDQYNTYLYRGPASFSGGNDYWVCYNDIVSLPADYALGTNGSDTTGPTAETGEWLFMAFRAWLEGTTFRYRFWYDLINNLFIERTGTGQISTDTSHMVAIGNVPYSATEFYTGAFVGFKFWKAALPLPAMQREAMSVWPVMDQWRQAIWAILPMFNAATAHLDYSGNGNHFERDGASTRFLNAEDPPIILRPPTPRKWFHFLATSTTTTVQKTATIDSALSKQFSLTATADSAILKEILKTVQLSGGLNKEFLSSLSVDSVIGVMNTLTASLHSAIRSTLEISATTEAAIRKELIKALSTNAVLQKEFSSSITAEAAVQALKTATASLQGTLQSLNSITAALNGAVEKQAAQITTTLAGLVQTTISVTAALSANISNVGTVELSISLQAAIRLLQEIATTMSAAVQVARTRLSTLSGTLQAQEQVISTLSGVLVFTLTRAINLNAILSKTLTNNAILDARLVILTLVSITLQGLIMATIRPTVALQAALIGLNKETTIELSGILSSDVWGKEVTLNRTWTPESPV